MTDHTPTPWRMSPSHIEEGPSAVRTGRDYPEDYIVCTTASDADAAFIVKAMNNHAALLEFFRWAMREGPWDGGDLDGGSVQDKAESLGLIVKTQYDAEKHGIQSEFETGDDWFEYAPDLRHPVSRSGAPDAS